MNCEVTPCPEPAGPVKQAKALPLARWLGLVVLLVEVWVLTYQLRFGRLAELDGQWVSVAETVRTLASMLIAALAATAVFGWNGFRDVLREHSDAIQLNHSAWPFFLANLIAFAGYFVLTAWLLHNRALSPALLAVWAFLGASSFAFLALAVLPARICLKLVRRDWRACLAGLSAGALAFSLGRFTAAWWLPLSEATFWLVRLLLSLMTIDVVYEQDNFHIGTSAYGVEIAPECSGYEGIGLVGVFMAAYLCFCRRSLRFPGALLLLPVGAALIWLTNALRITALILMGTHWSGDIAERGFHSQAGWLAFNGVCLGLVVVSHRWGFFHRDRDEVSRAERLNPAAPYLVPFVVLMTAMMVCAAFSAGFDYLYPVRVAAVAFTLLWFWREYARWSWQWSWSAVGVGGVVFVAWLALEHFHKGLPDDAAFVSALDKMPWGLTAAWMSFRVLGFVITVPLAEELAFRGFLIRRLQRSDFQEVPPNSFSWLSFGVSSLLFGFLHDRWLAGVAAGMLYACVLYRRGQLADAVLAHATTNGLIAIYVLTTGTWSLWL